MTHTFTRPDSGFRAVFFDCDGVLVDSEPAMAEVGALALRDFGLPAEPEDFIPFIGTGEESYIGGVARKYGSAYRPEMKQNLYDKYVALCERYVRPMPGAADLVRRLKAAGFLLAMVTSADRVKALANLRVLGLNETAFDAVITGSDVTRKKPHPDIYECAAQRCGVAPELAVVVEDAESGLQSAVRAGMLPVGLTSSLPADRLTSAGARHVIDTLSELAPLLGAGPDPVS